MTHKPTKETKATVAAMVSYGIPQKDICAVIGGIDDKTLQKHYKKEIQTSTAKANAQVAQKLYQKCMNGDTTSLIFWLKTRAKWRETDKDEAPPADKIAKALSEIADKLPG